MPLQRIYLDQMAWIQLTQARVGHKNGVRYEDAYLMAQKATSLGEASFPLSLTHQYETQQRQNWTSRLEVVTTMVELSKFQAIAHPTVVVPQEVDNAIAQMIGLPISPVRVFGAGLDFITGKSFGRFAIPSQINLEDLGYPESFSTLIRNHPERASEIILMAGPHPDMQPQYRVAFDALKALDTKFSDGQTEIARMIKELRIKNELDNAMTGYAILEIKEDLILGAARKGISPNFILDLMQGQAENYHHLLESIPSRHIVKELQFMQHKQSQKKWKHNDLSDLTALGIAVPYCDAVVTEKYWTDAIRRRHLDQRHRTTVSGDLADLPKILVDPIFRHTSPKHVIPHLGRK